MKTATVTLTEAQVRRLDEESRQSGLPTDALIGRAIDTFFGLGSNGGSPAGDDDAERTSAPGSALESPFGWMVGLGASDLREHVDAAADVEDVLAREWSTYIAEDSFGGTRTSKTSSREQNDSDLPEPHREDLSG